MGAIYPDLAQRLMEEGIESLALNRRHVVEAWPYVVRKAKRAASA